LEQLGNSRTRPNRATAAQQELKRIKRETGAENFLEKVGIPENLLTYYDVLAEPEHMLTHTPRIPGLDGRKMSKSYGNAITLSESDVDIRAKTKVMVTDPARKRRTILEIRTCVRSTTGINYSRLRKP